MQSKFPGKLLSTLEKTHHVVIPQKSIVHSGEEFSFDDAYFQTLNREQKTLLLKGFSLSDPAEDSLLFGSNVVSLALADQDRKRIMNVIVDLGDGLIRTSDMEEGYHLKEVRFFHDFLVSIGRSDLVELRKQTQLCQDQFLEAYHSWKALIPKVLQPFFVDPKKSDLAVEQKCVEMESLLGSRNKVILTLTLLLGKRSKSWQSYPLYELSAYPILRSYSAEQLAEVWNGCQLSPALCDGIARFVYTCTRKDRDLKIHSLLGKALKRRLYAHGRNSGHDDDQFNIVLLFSPLGSLICKALYYLNFFSEA